MPWQGVQTKGMEKLLKAWQIVKHGEPEQALQCVTTALPEPGPGELSIAVAAAGVGLPDLLMCRGRYEYQPALPFTPGQEVVGRVLAAGAGVKLRPGQRVMGVTCFYNGQGGFAEQCMSTPDMIYGVPDEMPDEQAAGFVIPWHTAWIGLVSRARIRAGESLLVLGAAGGSGSAALSLGKALGAEVIAAAGDEAKQAWCRQLGADHVLNYRQQDITACCNELTGGRGVDVVFDPVGGELGAEVVGCIASTGRLLLVGFASGQWSRAPSHQLVMRNCSALGVFVGAYSPRQRRRVNTELLRLYRAGRINPGVDRVLEFNQTPAALADLAARRVSGKTVIRVSSQF